MESSETKIEKYSDRYREQLLIVWEQSVLKTHSFLKPEDFLSIKEAVLTIDFNAFDVYCLTKKSKLLGFLGVADQKVEMLFLSPDCLGQGLGKKLMEFAIHELKANKVDVNEQNLSAVAFYEKFGFKTYERTEKDDQGKEYPLLRMKRNPIAPL
jgi:putative acetyltransferase